MRKNTKKAIALFLASLMMLSLLAGCGGTNSGASSASSASGASADAEPAALTMEDLKGMDWAAIEEAAKKEGEVTFTVWYNEAGFTEILKLFTEKYGIEANLVVSEQKAFAQKALAEKDGEVGTIDVAVVGEMVKTLLDAGVMAGPLLDKMEHKDVLDPGLSQYQEGIATNGYVVPLYLNQTGFLYNSDNIAEADLPQTWADFEAYIQANPMKFGICPPEKGGSGQAFTMLAIQELTGGLDPYYGDTEVVDSKVEQWDAVWSWVNANKDKITFTTSNNDSASRLNQGELDLVVAWSDDTTVARKAGELGPNAKFYIPDMGLAGGGDTVGMVANAEHKAAALLLVNWLTSEEAQTQIAQLLNAVPARTDVPVVDSPIPPEDMENRVAWIPAVYKTKFIQDFTTSVLRG